MAIQTETQNFIVKGKAPSYYICIPNKYEEGVEDWEQSDDFNTIAESPKFFQVPPDEEPYADEYIYNLIRRHYGENPNDIFTHVTRWHQNYDWNYRYNPEKYYRSVYIDNIDIERDKIKRLAEKLKKHDHLIIRELYPGDKVKILFHEEGIATNIHENRFYFNPKTAKRQLSATLRYQAKGRKKQSTLNISSVIRLSLEMTNAFQKALPKRGYYSIVLKELYESETGENTATLIMCKTVLMTELFGKGSWRNLQAFKEIKKLWPKLSEKQKGKIPRFQAWFEREMKLPVVNKELRIRKNSIVRSYHAISDTDESG